MTESPTEQIKADQIIGHIQTDTFCENCGYNLHTQAVIRDERLGILICRCTECGRWTAAGKATSAGRVWLNRFGTMLLTTWVFFLLFVFGLSTLFLGMLAYGVVHSQTYWSSVDHVNPRTGKHETVTLYTLEPHNQWDENEDARARNATGTLILRGIAILLASIVGGMSAVFLWHVKGKSRLWALAIPMAACACALLFWINDPMAEDLQGWGQRQLAVILLIDIAAMLTGLALGRPIARLMLRLFIPPKPRQHLAFLWTVDGKTLTV